MIDLFQAWTHRLTITGADHWHCDPAAAALNNPLYWKIDDMVLPADAALAILDHALDLWANFA